MPEPAHTDPDTTEVRHLPVLSDVPEARPLERRYPRLPVPAPVVAATAGFLAGVATFVLVKVMRRSRSSRAVRRFGGRRKSQDVVASRSFLVDVHLLSKR